MQKCCKLDKTKTKERKQNETLALPLPPNALHTLEEKQTHKHILKHPHKEKKINGSEIITIEENGML